MIKRVLIFVFLFVFSMPTLAALEPLKNAPDPQEDALPENKIELLYPDLFAQDISDQVNNLANWLDSFFGDARTADESRQSTLKIIPSQTFYDGGPSPSSIGVNLNLKLKNFDTKARKLEEDIKEKLTSKETPSSNEVGKSKSTKKSKNKPTSKPTKNVKPIDEWIYGLETNLMYTTGLFLSTKVRARKNYEAGIFIHRLALELGWDSDIYWTQKTGFISDKGLKPYLLFRFANEATWFISGKNFVTSHGPSLIQTINEYNSVSYNLRRFFAVVNNSFSIDNTSINLDFRHGTPSKKIYLDLIPEYSYPRASNYSESRSITFRLEYIF